MQAILKLSVSDTVDPPLKQRTQTESSIHDTAKSTKPLNVSTEQSAGIEKLNSLCMAVTRPCKTMRWFLPNCRCSCHARLAPANHRLSASQLLRQLYTTAAVHSFLSSKKPKINADDLLSSKMVCEPGNIDFHVQHCFSHTQYQI